ncbi:MAG: hypothetical protein RMJ51_02320 [Candidatus Calescibacterium sp.]|nr:hypothetical protein [Candidatus Calescibacterium sp.]MCX7972335.1 hypothetical protein [bacterium]MDW8195061.1 hypothetical protein [Candidatus Calescibacterium sp.]
MEIKRYTTLAVGEEGEVRLPGPRPQPLPVYQPREVTTLAVGEEGENRKPEDIIVSTAMVGEEGEKITPPCDNYTTLAVGEEGGHIQYPITQNDILQIYLGILLLYLSQYNNSVNMSFGRANV